MATRHPQSVQEILALGELRVSGAGGDWIARGHAASVLAHLVVVRGRSSTVDSLVQVVWPGRPPAHPRQEVRNVISGLRRRLGRDAIETNAGGYRLSPDWVIVDIWEIRDQLAKAAIDRANQAWHEVLQVSHDVSPRLELPLWHRLDGSIFDDDRLLWENERLGFLSAVAASASKLGDYPTMVEAARSALRSDRYAEPVWGALIDGLVRSGARVAALR